MKWLPSVFLVATIHLIYDVNILLRGILKKEKTALVELGVFFTYMRKLMDSVAETAFLGQPAASHSV